MSLPNEVIPLLAGAQQEYQISRSLRFNSADSAYLNRTFAGASDTKKWTWSGWLKRSTVSDGGYQTFFSAGTNSSNFDYLGFNSSTDDNRLIFGIVSGGGDAVRVSTNRLFRDFSAWYHIVVVYDSAQATAADRVKVYVNGTQETSFFETTYPSLNGVSFINGSSAHNIGRNSVLATRYYGGYLTEVNFIDGQALTPSSFGETSSTTGVWIPKKYTGTYGTNGFYLSFSDNSATTSTTLGKDSSGNSNNWTPNNFSVTAGVGNDSLTDTPTNYGTDTGVGGELRGNFCTLNSIDKSAATSMTNGNLDTTYSGSAYYAGARGTFAVSSGKWYWEVTVTAIGSGGVYSYIGIGQAFNYDTTNIAIYDTSTRYYMGDGNKSIGTGAGQTVSAYGETYTTNDVIGVALDMDNGTITFYKNNVSQGQAFTGLTGTVFPMNAVLLNVAHAFNFGQRPFAYTAPSGYKALCAQNLPIPTILNGSKYMNAVTWTGTGATRSITGVGFQPDLVWSKSRSNSETNKLVDSTRGATKALSSETTGDEVTESGITSFDADGFTIDGTTDTGYNTNTYTYVGWAWKKGATPGFDIVTYTGNGTARTISHSLGAVPHFMLVKARTTAGADQSWAVYHRNLTSASYYLSLNATTAQTLDTTVWNATAPTSSVFSVGTNARTNTNNDTYLAYLFTEIAGFSSFGTFTGNGSTNGPFAWCGFRPRFVLIKHRAGSVNWIIYDTVRSSSGNPCVFKLYPNLSVSNQESTTGQDMDILSNGFKMRASDGTSNASGQPYIFAAFAENPFKYSRAR